ncbi:hypothetical protein Tco_0354231, partial [Tanacetum coccineum]
VHCGFVDVVNDLKTWGVISGSTSSHVSKSTRSALAQSSGSTTRPGPFMDNFDNESDDDDDDACVEILLVTLIRSAVVIPSSGN